MGFGVSRDRHQFSHRKLFVTSVYALEVLSNDAQQLASLVSGPGDADRDRSPQYVPSHQRPALGVFEYYACAPYVFRFSMHVGFYDEARHQSFRKHSIVAIDEAETLVGSELAIEYRFFLCQ